MSSTGGKRRVVFLDRDGALIYDRPGFYLLHPDHLRLYRDTPQALRLLQRSGYALVIVTNQAGVGRGWITHATLGRIHGRLLGLLARRGIRIDGIYYCPHEPESGCRCRKPLPTLARRATKELGLTLDGSAMIGDKRADVDMARALGIRSVHLGTGHGRAERAKHGRALRPTHKARNILAAARWIVRTQDAAPGGGTGPSGPSTGRFAPGMRQAPRERMYSLRAARKAALASLAATLLPLAAAAAGPLPLSTETIKSPYDLVLGTASSPAELSAMPWYNESLEYEVKWGIFEVGTSNLRASQLEDFNGLPAVRIVSEAKSNGFCDKFYKVRDLNESWIDAKTFHSLGYSKKLREGQFFRDEWVLYDYDAARFISRRTGKDGNYTVDVGTIPVPVQDILSSIYFLRSKPLHVGDQIVLDVNTKSTWPLVAKVKRKRRVETPAGEFDTVLVEPELRQEGIFVQKGKRLQVYMTDDARHLPVYMSVDVFFGAVSAALTKIQK